MDNTQGEPQPSQLIPSLSNPQQMPLRVNPKYSLHSSLPIPQNMSQPSLPSDAEGNGAARTTSRRRRISGSGQDRVNSLTQPAISNAQTGTYHKPHANESPTSPTTNNLASFAARARAAPSDLVPAGVPKTELDPVSHSIRPSRRGSINRPPGAVYSEIRGTERKTFSSPRVEPSSPQYSSNITTPRQNWDTEPKPKQKIPNDTTTPKSLEDGSYSQAQSQPRRASTGVTGPRTEWAADRSPLQKLEVKLNDISKEEKRARVEEAEQQLKESQLGGNTRERDREADPSVNRRQSRRASAGSGIQPRSQLTHQFSDSKHQVPPFEKQVQPNGPRGVQETEQSRGIARSNKQRYSTGPDTFSQPKAVPNPSTTQNPRRSLGSPESGQLPERGVRFQNTNSPREISPIPTSQVGKPLTKSEDRALKSSGFIPSTAKTEGGPRTPQDKLRQEPAANLGGKLDRRSDALKQRSSHTENSVSTDQPPNQIGHSNREAPDHQIPSQITSTMHPRRNSGPGNDPDQVIHRSTQHRHHLSDVLHHRRESGTIADNRPELRSRRLDEWRQGGTARLTLADFNPSIDKSANRNAWWEKGKSNGIANTNGVRSNNSRGAQSVDGGYDEGYGKNQFPLSFQDEPSGKVPGRSSLDDGSVRVRPYIGNDGDTAAMWKNGLGFKSQFSHSHLRSKENPRLRLSTQYSYSCPQLAEHDIFHLHHICKPYMSKELTQSMRSIRIRAAPTPTSFDPPLYLKCGPLLRYTGLKRDRLQESKDPRNHGSAERETWRGSVMIVTIDAESSYNPVPVLRLYPEPIDLLPPPPQKIDDENGHSLPSEYIDPIAGLPKLSRTGQTIYVKPVEDLEQEVDLSRIEDDGGLFEETRTAVVPTSYGQPTNRPRRDITPSSANSKTRRREREIQTRYRQVKGVRLHAERGVTFWRFNLEVELGDHQARIAYRINNSASVGFWVPARGQSMNIMFHSCNGFSMSVKLVSDILQSNDSDCVG